MRLICASSLWGGASDVVFKDTSRQKLSTVLQSRYTRESYNNNIHNKGELGYVNLGTLLTAVPSRSGVVFPGQ